MGPRAQGSGVGGGGGEETFLSRVGGKMKAGGYAAVCPQQGDCYYLYIIFALLAPPRSIHGPRSPLNHLLQSV